MGGDEDKNPTFDFDFADAMSKPLPDWFQKEREEREKYIKGLEENRERIMKEFKEKYDISERQKAADREAKWQAFKLRNEKKKKNKKWLTSLFSPSSIVVEEEEESEETTREKWEQIWDLNSDGEEEKEWMLPGLLEVFPELNMLKWPIWSKNKNGRVTRCETDSDCPFPQACCPHPILPGDKFCCTGFGSRIMEPAYAPQQISSRGLGDEDARDNEDGERRRQGKKAWQGLDD